MSTGLRELDWPGLLAELDTRGFAKTKRVLTAAQCKSLIALYDEDAPFRSRVDMERHRFGSGDYAYFSHPLPPLVRELRTELYRRLAPLANRWAAALGRDMRFPPSLRSFLARCHAQGQTRPTPLLLRYRSDGYNCLHQDLYGGIFFPLQVTIFLSEPDVDYGGGEFLLVEQRPRAQSAGTAFRAARGEILIFPNSERPALGKRGTHRVVLRHGVSRLTWGERYALGIIFHDAR